MRKRRHKKRSQKKRCYSKFGGAAKVMQCLLVDYSFLRAAHASTTPRGFNKHVQMLTAITDNYKNYRISLSSTDGRTYFDTAFPATSHNGKNVKDINGENINVSGGVEVQYANLITYEVVYERSKGFGKEHGVGADARWDETVGAIQYFLARTIRRDTCDVEAFVLRVSHKPDALPSSIIPIKAQDFAIVDNQPFIVVDNNIIPVKPENIAVIANQTFAVVNGQPFLLPDQKMSANIPAL